MKTTLIMLPQPILVSDEKIKGGDILPYVMKWENGYEVFNLNNGIRESKLSRAYKIIAGIEGLPKLDLSLTAERIGWVDVEKLAKEYSGMRSAQSSSVDTSLHNARVAAFREGFKAAQSLNEKNYTKSDVIKAMEYALENQCPFQVELYQYFIDDLSKPKEYQVEWIQEGDAIKITKIIN